MSAARLAKRQAGAKRYAPLGGRFGGGSNLRREGQLGGLQDVKVGLFSAWLNRTSAGGSARVLRTTNGRFFISFGSTNKFNITAANPAGSNVLSMLTTATFGAGLTHFFAYWNLADDLRRLYINGSLAALDTSTSANDNIDYTDNNVAIGGQVDSTLRFSGDMYDLWFHDVTLSVSSEEDIRAAVSKFISLAGKPLPLGMSGERPFGFSPRLFLSGDASLFPGNRGTGGGFTVIGSALADAPRLII